MTTNNQKTTDDKPQMYLKCQVGEPCEYFASCEIHDMQGCIELKIVSNDIKNTLLKNLLLLKKSNARDVLYNKIEECYDSVEILNLTTEYLKLALNV